jgi:urease accessory protein
LIGAPRDEARAGVSKDEGTHHSALYRLMAWLSPAYPVGAFAYSGGLEWAIEAGDIVDRKTLGDWLSTIMAEGSGFCDAVLFGHAHRAIEESDDEHLRATAELAAALVPSKERFLETTTQGRSFLETARLAWDCPAIDRLERIWDGPLAYPVAVAVATAGHGVPRAPAVGAFLQAVAANLVSAGVRLIPLGQTDGQRLVAELESLLAKTAQRALACPLDRIAGATFRSDLASMRHETQHTRLFRS